MLRIAITLAYHFFFFAMIPFDRTLKSQQKKHEVSGSSKLRIQN